MSREEVIAALRECAEKMGRCPSVAELSRVSKITRNDIRTTFGTYTKAVVACGLEQQGPGYRVSMNDLFAEWAGMVRELGVVPTLAEYGVRSQYSPRPLLNRFGLWKHVPAGLLQYAIEEGMEGEWGDVLDVINGYYRTNEKAGKTSAKPASTTPKPVILADRPIYGPSLVPAALAHGPINEMGVVYLFGMLAGKLGFVVTRVQQEFPDCEAMREVAEGQWQRVRIEFEYESYNFLRHMHQTSECDLIVCWAHNWKACPLDVIELKSVVQGECQVCQSCGR